MPSLPEQHKGIGRRTAGVLAKAGDPPGPLVDITNSLVNVLVSAQLANAGLAR